MKLQVVYQDEAAGLPPDCYVSLPTPVARSLSEMQPFASLTVLRVRTHLPYSPRFTSITNNRTNQTASQTPIYVAWTGNSIDQSASLGITPQFAEALGLHQGETVSVTVQERVVDNKPRRILRNATLRPISYDTCPTASPHTDHSDADRAFEAAMGDFAMLNGTAGALEKTLLAQIRVLHRGLTFPLRLPARQVVTVRVENVTAANLHPETESADIPYALLMPDSEVYVQSPPVRAPAKESLQSSNRSLLKVHAFYRVVSQNRALASGLPRQLAKTHAVIGYSGSFMPAFERDRYAVVSRKSSSKSKQLAYPVAFQFHPAIPARHVHLPAAVWYDLQLTSLTPVLVEEVPPFDRGSEQLAVQNLDSSLVDLSPSFQELSSASSVYYDGMLLQKHRVHVTNSARETGNGETALAEVEPWEQKEISKEEESKVRANPLVPVIESKLSEAQLLLAAGRKRQIKQGFRSFPEQTLRLQEAEDIFTRDRKLSVPKRSREPPSLNQEDAERRSLMSLSASGRDAVDDIMHTAKSLFRNNSSVQNRRRKYKTGVLEGVSGSGKTYIAKVVASLLRELGHVRTVFVRCRSHSAESTKASMRRIGLAFEAATDGGPGLVILDDIDILLGNRKSLTEKSENENDPRSARRSREIASEIERQLRASSHVQQVMLLMTCERTQDLDSVLKSPGFINCFAKLSLPSAKERALMYWIAIQKLSETRSIDNLHEAREQVSDLGQLSEGYSPRDVNNSLKRACIEMDLSYGEHALVDARLVVQVIKDVMKTMTPSISSGTTFFKPRKDEKMSWDSIGGLEKAKNLVWEALQLPGTRPEIFANAPIRLPHGILLYGPPGCGKTMLAKIAAVESGMQCVLVKGPELLSKYIGESEAEVRRAFEKASNAAPCVLLFDEFDALAPRRGGESSGVADRVVNTLLTCMDGAERLSDMVYVVATTSRPEVIDPAVLRPGRLDRWVAVDLPASKEERLDILIRQCKDMFPYTESLELALEKLAESTDGFTGADLEALVGDAHVKQKKLETPTQADSEESGGMTTADLFNAALRESRPSLSRSQQTYYHQMMLRFSADDAEMASENLVQLDASFGKRVTLK